ncbi:hypothetical protein PO909_011207 [Leuciscus waleckii]
MLVFGGGDGRKQPSTLFGAGSLGGDHSRPSWSTALVRRRKSSASSPARVRPESWTDEEAVDHTTLSDARMEQLSAAASSSNLSASSPEAGAARADEAGGWAAGRGGGEGEGEARGRGSGELLGATSVSGGLCERRFFLRGPAETGGVTAWSKTSSRARRVDIESSSHSGQPPAESAVAACLQPRQRAQMRWRSPLLSGAWHEPQEKRGILRKTPHALLEERREKVCVAGRAHTAMKGYVAGQRSRHGWLKAAKVAGFLRHFLGLLVAGFNGGGSQDPAMRRASLKTRKSDFSL